MAVPIVQLRCGVKNDAWGKKGKESLSARLWAQTPGNGPIDENQTYSEMWMGTYPSNPSYVLSNGELLSDYIKNNPQVVGDAVMKRWGAEIPFLPKILSFSSALSLQLHPDKELAEKLHHKDPKRFGDSNHKPEIAVALSKFELFVGWKPLNDIQALFELPALKRFTPSESQFNDQTLKLICKALLEASPDTVNETVKELQKIPTEQFGPYPYIPSILDRLSAQHSEFDNGNLVAALLMNYMIIGPGDAVCVPADSVHAYLSGDIVECMARSDNVLNVGFCPRADRDSVDLFTQALTFKPHSSQEAELPRKTSDKGLSGRTVEYAPPMSEFNVLATSLALDETETHKAILGPSLMIVTEGSGKMEAHGATTALDEGQVFFVGQGISLEFSTPTSMTIYRAYAE
ncbi:mannose-6-phosphate isomerase [Aspergillus candidus]|uniref:Mannose-6-phosphate isomerase n=1 Tax=Aspergillus candidus TaxID=41067 RepID=A0A2I2F2N0_ASPCN|nr:mannose-6-phosphate isomerase [Aspergillus candidus]PLB34868.1 mannose-6-phosphate isomerase [Aspergillus candidus]